MYVRNLDAFSLCVRLSVRDKTSQIRRIRIVDDTLARWHCFPKTTLVMQQSRGTCVSVGNAVYYFADTIRQAVRQVFLKFVVVIALFFFFCKANWL